MRVNSVFEIPDSVLANLVKGSMVRRGSVIQWSTGANAGQIVMWLRETQPSPIPSSEITKLVEPFLPLAQFATPILSLINLGATVGFGVAILNKLSRIESKIDNLQWTIEYGFAQTLSAIEELKLNQTIDVWTNAYTAAKLAWDSQKLDPESHQRIARLENSLHSATLACENFMLRAGASTNRIVDKFSASYNGSTEKLRCSINQNTIQDLMELRNAVIASSLRAKIQAETDPLFNCAGSLGHDAERLDKMLKEIGKSFLRTKWFCYDNLLNAEFRDTIPVSRIDTWSRRYDPSTNGIFGVLELFRKTSNSLAIQGGSQFIDIKRKAIVEFVNLLDAIHEDIERLMGHVAEYEFAAKEGISIQTYRELFKVEDSNNSPISLFTEVDDKLTHF